MKTILTIGHNHFLLGSGANINALVALLDKVKTVERKYVSSQAGDLYILTGAAPDTQITFIQDSQVVQPPKPKAIPEKASPDADNTF